MTLGAPDGTPHEGQNVPYDVSSWGAKPDTNQEETSNKPKERDMLYDYLACVLQMSRKTSKVESY